MSETGNADNNRRLMSRKRILKNLVTIAFSHFLVFSSFDSLSNLQSTINSEDGLGVSSQAVIYACFTASAFFLPTFLIKKFGCKTTLVISVFGICPYIAANSYPCWASLLPTAVLCGSSFGPLWAARSTYLNEISHQYAAHVRGSIEVVNAWFFGTYSFFHENAEIWGNVISYLTLRSANDTEPLHFNRTSALCGASFCDFHSYDWNPNLTPPSSDRRFLLVFLFFSLVVVAGCIIQFLLDPLQKKVFNKTASCEKHLFMSTIRHLSKKNQLLLVPISFYCGLADGFYNSDFTRSYIACSLGISYVGYVTICYGIACAFMDSVSGFCVKFFTRISVFLFAAIAHLTMLIASLLWQPTASYNLYFLSAVYGLGSSVWWTQIAALHGVLFRKNEEAAFSNFYLWSSLGLLLAYSYSDHVCTVFKIYILIAFLVFGVLGYAFVERRRCGLCWKNDAPETDGQDIANGM